MERTICQKRKCGVDLSLSIQSTQMLNWVVWWCPPSLCFFLVSLFFCFSWKWKLSSRNFEKARVKKKAEKITQAQRKSQVKLLAQREKISSKLRTKELCPFILKKRRGVLLFKRREGDKKEERNERIAQKRGRVRKENTFFELERTKMVGNRLSSLSHVYPTSSKRKRQLTFLLSNKHTSWARQERLENRKKRVYALLHKKGTMGFFLCFETMFLRQRLNNFLPFLLFPFPCLCQLFLPSLPLSCSTSLFYIVSAPFSLPSL